MYKRSNKFTFILLVILKKWLIHCHDFMGSPEDEPYWTCWTIVAAWGRCLWSRVKTSQHTLKTCQKKFGSDIHGPLRMNHTSSGESLHPVGDVIWMTSPPFQHRTQNVREQLNCDAEWPKGNGNANGKRKSRLHAWLKTMFCIIQFRNPVISLCN